MLQAQPSDNIWRILPVSCPLTILWAGAIKAQAIPMINSHMSISLCIIKVFLNTRTGEEGKHHPLTQSQALLKDRMKVTCVSSLKLYTDLFLFQVSIKLENKLLAFWVSLRQIRISCSSCWHFMLLDYRSRWNRWSNSWFSFSRSSLQGYWKLKPGGIW